MRVKAIFSVYGRNLPSGKKVFYYQCYDKEGKRQFAKSTGLTKKTEAMAYCMKLYKEGLLIPEQKAPTFAEFCDGWWDIDTCRYLKWRQLHDPLSQGTILIYKYNFEKHIKEYFSKFKLDEINPTVIEDWLLSMIAKGLKPSSVNIQYKTLRIMIGEAARLKIVKTNPCKEVKEIKGEEFKRQILTVEEARKLFTPDWPTVWKSEIVYKAHLLAACTGLRSGELLGLKGEHVFNDYIYITGQYTRKEYIPNTKDKHNRNIPIPSQMRMELAELLQANGKGYVFSEDGGKTPIAVERLNRQFDRALEKIGISNDERVKRNLSFHAWRHFFNTLLLSYNVGHKKVQAVTGHRTNKMTDHYTHFDTKKFSDIRDVQVELLTGQKPVANEVLKVVTETAEKATA